jgi:hypothetical protein
LAGKSEEPMAAVRTSGGRVGEEKRQCRSVTKILNGRAARILAKILPIPYATLHL